MFSGSATEVSFGSPTQMFCGSPTQMLSDSAAETFFGSPTEIFSGFQIHPLTPLTPITPSPSMWGKLKINFVSTCLVYQIGLHDLLSILRREEYVRSQSDAREEPEEQGKTAVAICPGRALFLQMFICIPNPTLR